MTLLFVIVQIHPTSIARYILTFRFYTVHYHAWEKYWREEILVNLANNAQLTTIPSPILVNTVKLLKTSITFAKNILYLLCQYIAIHQTFTPPNLPTYSNTKVTS